MCTFITRQDKQGNTYIGRTIEMSDEQDYRMSYYPAGMSFQSKAPDGKPSVAFTTKYGFVSVDVVNAVPIIKEPFVNEGSNEAGLSISSNTLTNSLRTNLPPEIAAKSLYLIDFNKWVLGMFDNVTDLKAALESGVSTWGEEATKPLSYLHFAITDKTGKSIVVEFLNNSQQVYDNPVGIMTNAPAFPWHLDNLHNYAHLTNIDKNTGQFGSLKVTAPDSGIAMHSVPASQISWGRFVKAAFYKEFVKIGDTPDENILLMSHIMNNFDRPMDATKDIDGLSVEGSGESEVTMVTILFDASRKLWYVRTIKDINWVKVDINALKSLKEYTSYSWIGFKGFDAPASA
jgi:penicillin V acylase-like amidase (Ntn superfamily)